MRRIIPILVLALLLTSCSPRSVGSSSRASPVDTSIGSDSELSKSAPAVQFNSELGCSVTYDPELFTARDYEDEYQKRITQFIVESSWENAGFTLNVRVTLLDASSVEEAVNQMCGSMNLDTAHEVGIRNEAIREEVTFGSGDYSATHLAYNEQYAVGEIYVTEQSGNVFSVEISSYYQPSEELLASAYAILDSVTF